MITLVWYANIEKGTLVILTLELIMNYLSLWQSRTTLASVPLFFVCFITTQMKEPAMSKIIDNFKHLFYNTPLHFLSLCIESTNKPLPQTFYHKSFYVYQ